MKTTAVGHVLAEDTGEPTPLPVLFLHAVNGSGTELLPYSRAEALLKQVSASPNLRVTGGLAHGFAWPVPGAHPRRSHAVIPLAAPAWPASSAGVCVALELWWAIDPLSGLRRVRTYSGLFTDSFTAYLAACCLWARADTGRGATLAVLYDSDGMAYVVEHAALVCGQLPVPLMDRLVATCSERFTTDAPPATALSGAVSGEDIA